MSGARTINRWLAAAALLLAALAPVAGSPFRSAGRLDADGAARLRALDLADWLRERRSLRVVDLRDSLRFEAFHLPRAARMTDDEVAALRLMPSDTLVLYGDEAAVARALDRLRGRPARVVYLVDGVGEWLADVMNPILPPDAADDERARFARTAELSRYFGGIPRYGVRDSTESAQLLEQTRRRGCAF